MDTEHLFEFLAQMARNQMQWLLEHGASLNGVKGFALLEAAMKLFDKRAFPGPHGAHQV